MRTSVIVASVALVALAILAPSDAGCLPHGGCLSANVASSSAHYKDSKSSQESESDESCSVNEIDLGPAKLKQTVESGNFSDDEDSESSECDEQTIDTPNGRMVKKSTKSSKMEKDKDSSYFRSTSKVVPDCGC